MILTRDELREFRNEYNFFFGLRTSNVEPHTIYLQYVVTHFHAKSVWVPFYWREHAIIIEPTFPPTSLIYA